MVANTGAKALPSQSIIKIGNEKSILVLEKNENEIYYFKKVTITPKKLLMGILKLKNKKTLKTY